MSFPKQCHMPFRKLIPPFNLTASIRQRLKFLFYIPSHVINVLPKLKGRASPFVDSKFNVTSSPISTNGAQYFTALNSSDSCIHFMA